MAHSAVSMDITEDITMLSVQTETCSTMAGLTRCHPRERCTILKMSAVASDAVFMTVSARNSRPACDNIHYRGVSSPHIRGSGRTMAFAATKLMERRNTIRPGPFINKQGILGVTSSYFMAGITGRSAGKIGGAHQDIRMGMDVKVKVTRVTICTEMRSRGQIGVLR